MSGKVPFSLSLLMLLPLIQPVTAAEVPANTIDAQALTVLKKATDYIAKADSFSMALEYSYDVLQPSGMKIELGGTRKVQVSRPDRARIEFARRDGVRGNMFYDGKTVTLYNDEHKVYTQIQKDGSIGAVMDFLADNINIPIPARDFMSENATAILTANLMSAMYLGESSVNDVACHHLTLQTPEVDYQVWISSGKQPLPRRVVIDYKNAPSMPQFRANFLDWNMNPAITESVFSFMPEPGTEKIPLIIRTGNDTDEVKQ